MAQTQMVEELVLELVKQVVAALQALLNSDRRFEGVTAGVEWPNVEKDLPLQAPLVTLAEVTTTEESALMGDVAGDDGAKARTFTATYYLDVWTSRGRPDMPRVRAGGQVVARRIAGLLARKVNGGTSVPEFLESWKMYGSRAVDYQPEWDLIQLRQTLEVTGAVETD